MGEPQVHRVVLNMAEEQRLHAPQLHFLEHSLTGTLQKRGWLWKQNIRTDERVGTLQDMSPSLIAVVFAQL